MKKLLQGLGIVLMLFFAGSAFSVDGRSTLSYGGGGEGKVIFDGRTHAAAGLRCNDCHSDIFQTKKKALMTKEDHDGDGACFACHDGDKAFYKCTQCHRRIGDRVAPPKEKVALCGAATVADRLVAPLKDAVEKTSGYTVGIAVSNAGKGLTDLVDGKCDAAMSSASLETTVQAAKTGGKDVDIRQLKMHVIKSDEIAFIVNASNSVASLSPEQIRDIHTGKIGNWKEVGGQDLAITVITDSLTSATRGFIKQAVMANQDYAQNAVALGNISEMNDAVARTPGGIGGIGRGFADAQKVKIIQSDKVLRPLGFITIGEPSKKMQRVIDAYRTESQK
ncbi:substrate-binding domain-containing protein [Propionivibrio dicarboxylicus]|uniref:Cytochrome c7 n=1 Tax=Propionivibrio dicarboxylicus TaxID=83767 RepID=A0A1G8N676_9RHOO|nr:substrate-binding domain-containing protein [Propionivibrio dicarboxylicus]SDI75615.1 Cytochrome c7 [Propionivibrio dicarboxylicus]